ncbi:hypothetical protein TYRP_017106 [Tyrophagus putrescentiae]|nr:hypothetical protein TYRP_017106 [Tyrophagus putrescentiae]
MTIKMKQPIKKSASFSSFTFISINSPPSRLDKVLLRVIYAVLVISLAAIAGEMARQNTLKYYQQTMIPILWLPFEARPGSEGCVTPLVNELTGHWAKARSRQLCVRPSYMVMRAHWTTQGRLLRHRALKFAVDAGSQRRATDEDRLRLSGQDVPGGAHRRHVLHQHGGNKSKGQQGHQARKTQFFERSSYIVSVGHSTKQGRLFRQRKKVLQSGPGKRPSFTPRQSKSQSSQARKDDPQTGIRRSFFGITFQIVFSAEVLTTVLLLLLQSQSASAIRCKKDADCGNNSVCDNGTCVINIDCRINYDCVRFGIYQECQHYRCQPLKVKLEQ